MKRRDVDRIIDAKYRDYVEQIIARLKSLSGEVWLHFASDIQRGESFLFAEVAKTLARLTVQPNLPPAEVMAVRRAVAALKKLPGLTPEINVQIEVSHRVGDEGFSESCSCTINLDPEQIEISSGGSQY